MRPLWEAADFVRRTHRRLRFGELSRAPLRLLRFELRGQEAECEWMARPPDPWDADLPPAIARRNQTLPGAARHDCRSGTHVRCDFGN